MSAERTDEPRCDKCGVEMTTGLMAACCPAGKECEFWTPELDEFLAQLTPCIPSVEPKPCPFCGHVGVTGYEGSTFRWWYVACNGCGAQCGEVRVQTLDMPRDKAIEQAQREAIEEWNKRA